jgi:hypothetical protein
MPNWQWWYSQDDERWNGPCKTRKSAIGEGLSEYGGEPFMVCEARRHDLSTDISAYRLLEWLDEANEEYIDGDGNGHAFDPTPEQERDLEYSVEKAILQWAARNKIGLTGWAFAETRSHEDISIESKEYGEAHRMYYHDRIADMGRDALWAWWDGPIRPRGVGLRISYPLTLGVASRRDPRA